MFHNTLGNFRSYNKYYIKAADNIQLSTAEPETAIRVESADIHFQTHEGPCREFNR